jgi:hypothetical protein
MPAESLEAMQSVLTRAIMAERKAHSDMGNATNVLEAARKTWESRKQVTDAANLKIGAWHRRRAISP